MLISSSMFNAQAQPALKKPLSAQTPLFTGKKSEDTFSKKKALVSALLLSNAGIAAAAPVGRRNETSLLPEANVAPVLTTPLPLDLHQALSHTNPWDLTDSNKDTHQAITTRTDEADKKPKSRKLSAKDILKLPPFKPTDKTLFTQAVYGAPAAAPAASRSQADSALAKRIWEQTNDSKLKATVQDPWLFAALQNLKDTPGEDSIDAYRNVFGAARFAPLEPGIIARVVKSSDKKPEVEVNERYKNENFRLLSSTLDHEAKHQDLSISVAEERLAHAMDALGHGKMLAEKPSLLTPNTELSQRLNTKLLARLNSRDEKGNLRLFAPVQGGTVYPGGNLALANFGAAFSSTGATIPGVTIGPSSPGNAALRAELRKTTGKNKPNADFDADTEALVDKNQIALSPDELVKLAKLMKLDIGA